MATFDPAGIADARLSGRLALPARGFADLERRADPPPPRVPSPRAQVARERPSQPEKADTLSTVPLSVGLVRRRSALLRCAASQAVGSWFVPHDSVLGVWWELAQQCGWLSARRPFSGQIAHPSQQRLSVAVWHCPGAPHLLTSVPGPYPTVPCSADSGGGPNGTGGARREGRFEPDPHILA